MLLTASLIAAIVLNALVAGLFFAFSTAVLPGLRDVDDRAFVTIFRRINAAIQNPVFLAVFFGAPILAVLAAGTALIQGTELNTTMIVVGALLSAATFMFTSSRSVPLNTMLDRLPANTDADARSARERFEPLWSRWNVIRTLTATASVAVLSIALVF
ncbi:MAG: anthrone oxygenase family protein [Agrococcus casei]|uniref:Integral-membrane protein n=1 Tax=Agrococcus casei LMG 22410 TaxID=1255656 RepID=A0A1R4EQE7_9MICO|nr:anthrone oxygenase family protein [Agrococcus casei]SJM45789.1 integral-membrane protein [Agrococcus casei LMG 22410]